MKTKQIGAVAVIGLAVAWGPATVAAAAPLPACGSLSDVNCEAHVIQTEPTRGDYERSMDGGATYAPFTPEALLSTQLSECGAAYLTQHDELATWVGAASSAREDLRTATSQLAAARSTIASQRARIARLRERLDSN